MSRTIASVAVLMGILFETAVFAETPGIGYLFFWLSAFVGTLAILRSAERSFSKHLWMFLPSLLLSFSVFRFDASVVQTWGAGLALFFLAWAVAWNLVPEWREGCLAKLLPSETWNLAKVGSQAKDTLRVDTNIEKESAVQATRGVLLAAILLFVFGTLLSQADAVFGAKVSELLSCFKGLTPLPLVRTLFWLGLFAGGLKVWLVTRQVEVPRAKTFFSSTELSIALGSLNLLLISFLVIQARYLFGDSNLVETMGFSHAYYARRGFFELTICIALILPLVLLSYRAAEVHREGRLRLLGGGLILSAFGLAASAFRRMMLYIEVYGLSVDRYYAAAGILVAICILAWAAYACWRPRPVSWLVTRQNLTVIFLLALLGLVDVDSLVARSHLNLVQTGVRQMDSYYLSRLSADALPVIEEFQGNLAGEDLEKLAQVRESILNRVRAHDFVSYNISRHRAKPHPTSETCTKAEYVVEETGGFQANP